MNSTFWVPELLAPAGNLDKLKTAISYGADAVYLSGQKFGLRVASDNFTHAELKEGVEFAHTNGSQVYVVLNGFLHDSDLLELPDFVKYLESLKVDAVIVSDLGVIETVKAHSNLEVHLSTQASCVNSYSAKLWKGVGVTRVVLGREASIDDAKLIKDASGLEIEMFVHGSMCMAYSGNCVISNFTQGRDSNRGGCAHSCRFEYNLDIDGQKKNAFFMSSKDLEGLRVLEHFIKNEVDSLKVEGRMKSPHYAGTVSKVYSQALKFYSQNGHFLSDDLLKWESELAKVTGRDKTIAALEGPADSSSIYDEREHDDSEYVGSAVVLESNPDYQLIEVRSQFCVGDTLELLSFSGENYQIKVDFIKNFDGLDIEKTNPGMVVQIPPHQSSEPLCVIRGQK